MKEEAMSLFLIWAPGPVPDGPTSARHFRGAGIGESCNRTQRVKRAYTIPDSTLTNGTIPCH